MIEYYLEIKINEAKALIHSSKWVCLQNILWNETIQSQKTTHCIIPFMWNGARIWESDCRRVHSSSGCYENIIKVDYSDHHTTLNVLNTLKLYTFKIDPWTSQFWTMQGHLQASTDFFSINTAHVFSLHYDFLSNIFFAYFIVGIYDIIHII